MKNAFQNFPVFSAVVTCLVFSVGSVTCTVQSPPSICFPTRRLAASGMGHLFWLLVFSPDDFSTCVSIMNIERRVFQKSEFSLALFI